MVNAAAPRAALVIAAVYGYFLLFAQFAFVELLRTGGMNASVRQVPDFKAPTWGEAQLWRIRCCICRCCICQLRWARVGGGHAPARGFSPWRHGRYWRWPVGLPRPMASAWAQSLNRVPLAFVRSFGLGWHGGGPLPLNKPEDPGSSRIRHPTTPAAVGRSRLRRWRV